MKEIKVYNVIFPIWFLLFFPPVIFLTLLGNFIIDSLVVLGCFYLFKLSNQQMNVKAFYKKGIFKVWIYGFLADFAGAAILFFIEMLEGSLGISYEVISAISYDPFRHPLAVVIIVFSMIVSALLIFFLNYKLTFKTLIEDKALRFKVSLTLAIITIPWTFLLPTKWFYGEFYF